MSDVEPMGDAQLGALRVRLAAWQNGDHTYSPAQTQDGLSSLVARLDAAEAERDAILSKYTDLLDRYKATLRAPA